MGKVKEMIGAIRSFTGNHAFLSPSSEHSVKYDGIIYPTSEHAFLAAKCVDKDVKESISRTTSIETARKIAKKARQLVTGAIQDEFLMERIQRLKYTGGLKYDLIYTRPAMLTYGNFHHDQHLGSCYCPIHLLIPGENILGKISVGLREEFNQEWIETTRGTIAADSISRYLRYPNVAPGRV